MDVVETGSGPMTVVAVHGIQGTRGAWAGLAGTLGEQARFVLPNLRGRADALRGRGVEDYRLERLADDLEEAVRAYVGFRPFVLAGWSMGVSVALEYVSRAGVPRPCGLVLMSGTPMLDSAKWFHSSGDDLVAEIAEREKRLGLVEAADHDAVAWIWEGIRHTNHLHLLADITMPTLIVQGSEDGDSPLSHAERLAAGLPDAELRVLHGIGHSVLKDAPDEVARHVGAFIQRISGD
jgi:pimeloyl-ACP methyl ester carboxylesterase